jgi:hypothetical protein
MFRGQQQFCVTNWPMRGLMAAHESTLLLDARAQGVVTLLAHHCGGSGLPSDMPGFRAAAMFSIPVLLLFCCNETRITIFPGTCAALAYLG